MNSEIVAQPLDVREENIDSRRWLGLAVIVAAQFMVVLDVAIVNVALPSIKTDLHFSEANLQWVITAYAILFGGVLLLGGRLADLFGRRRLFVAGLGVFVVSSLLSGLAWSESSLIAFRALQGLGGALLAPAALSILMTTFAEGRDRNIALGVWGAASGTGGAAGVVLGGILTSYVHWSWIFFINVPVAAVVIGLTLSMQQVLHYSAIQTGVAFVATTLTVVVFSNVAQTLVTRLGARPVLTAGLLSAAASLVLLARLPVHGHYFRDLLPALILGGIGV